MDNREQFKKDLCKYAKKSECSCDKCKKMCRISPCLGTPRDLMTIYEKIGHEEFVKKFSITHVYFAVLTGIVKVPHVIVATNFDIDKKKCSFLNDEGLCEIHDVKPTEGVYSCHDDAEFIMNKIKNKEMEMGEAITYCVPNMILREWSNDIEAAREVLKIIINDNDELVERIVSYNKLIDI